MSVCAVIDGFFQLNNGRPAGGQTRSGRSSQHILYDSGILGPDKTPLFGAEIRVWSPKGVIFPENTVVVLHGRFYVPRRDIPTALIDAFEINPFDGNPEDDDYDKHIPSVQPRIIILGHAAAKAEMLSGGVLRACRIATGDYVRDMTQTFNIQAVFDTSEARWQKAPVPHPNSACQIIGTYHHVTSEGELAIKIIHVTLAIQALSASQAQQALGDDDKTASPTKKRKFGGARLTVSKSSPSSTSAPATSIPGPSTSATTAPTAILPYATPSLLSTPSQLNPFPNFFPAMSIGAGDENANGLLAPTRELQHRHSSPALGVAPSAQQTLQATLPLMFPTSDGSLPAFNFTDIGLWNSAMSAAFPAGIPVPVPSSVPAHVDLNATVPTKAKRTGTKKNSATLPPVPGLTQSPALPPIGSFQIPGNGTPPTRGIPIPEVATVSQVQQGKRPVEGEVNPSFFVQQ